MPNGFKLNSNNLTTFSDRFFLQADKDPEVDPDAFSKLQLLDARRQAEKESGNGPGNALHTQEQEAGRYVSYPGDTEYNTYRNCVCVYIYTFSSFMIA